MKKSWNLLLVLSLLLTICACPIPAGAAESTPGTNLMQGGYGWSSWTSMANALDGNKTTRASLGKHSAQSAYYMDMVTGSGAIETYNKVVMHIFNPQYVTHFTVVGAETIGTASEPAASTNYKVNGNTAYNARTGSVTVVPRTMIANANLDASDANRFVAELSAAQQSKYFFVIWNNEGKGENGGNSGVETSGLWEFQVYYVTPNTVKWEDDDAKVYKPASGTTVLEYDIPDYEVYDQLGDVMGTNLRAQFTDTITLQGETEGVTLENEKIKLSSACTADSVTLAYKATDKSNKTVLETTLTLPIATASADYTDVYAAADWLKTQLPATTEEDITLPTTYSGTGEVSISWSSNHTNYIANDGTVTRPNAAESDASVTLTATIACGSETIQKDYTVVVMAETSNEATEALSEASAALKWNVLSSQKQTAVSKPLILPMSDDGSLTIGDQIYSDMEIAWASSDEAVLSNKGVLHRAASDKNITLTATLSKVYEGRTYTVSVPFSVTVVAAGKAVDTKNLMNGGYGWITSGWGTPTQAVDGNTSTAWNIGDHTQTTITAGLKTASGNVEKYNKVVAHFYRFDHIINYSITGYTGGTNDPGKSASNLTFTPGTGATGVISYSAEDPSTIPGADGKVEAKFTAAKESKYFGVSLANSEKDTSGSNSCGMYEFEIYFLTPSAVRWNDASVKMYRPAAAGESITFALPEYTVYDEFGDALVDTSFTDNVVTAKDYAGVTVQNGTVTLTSDCTADEIDLLYTSGDDNGTYLRQILTIPVIVTNDDYDTMVEVAEALDEQIPATATANLNLPTMQDGVSITWSSDNTAHLAADGTVTRPDYDAEDATATLRAVLSIGDYTMTKTWNVTIVRDMTDAQIALVDANRIDLGVNGVVASDLTLPTKGYYGSSITWSSDRTDVISNTGTYQQITATNGSVKVVLTAKVTYNGTTIEKDFTVYAKTKQNGGGGGGGSSIGKRPTGGATVSTETPSAVMKPLTEEQLTSGGLFGDVPTDHWANFYVEALAKRKVVNGVAGGQFEPERSVTREEFLKMVITAFEITLKPGTVELIDVDADGWYADYVATAYKEGIINGISETQFGIGSNITRQDAAVIVQRVLDRLNVKYNGVNKAYGDENAIADYAVDAVANLTKAGIIGGNAEGNFLPSHQATRAEAAKIIYTAMEHGGMLR